jgi:hypothetical protein
MTGADRPNCAPVTSLRSANRPTHSRFVCRESETVDWLSGTCACRLFLVTDAGTMDLIRCPRCSSVESPGRPESDLISPHSLLVRNIARLNPRGGAGGEGCL